jgi:hypothetical protein
MNFPPEVTSAILTATAIFAGLFGTWLARKGKREDVKIAAANQILLEIRALAEERRVEIVVLRTELTAERLAHQETRLREEQRWDRQMKRCRIVTDNLVAALAQRWAEKGQQLRDDALRNLEQHNFEDHHKEE